MNDKPKEEGIDVVKEKIKNTAGTRHTDSVVGPTVAESTEDGLSKTTSGGTYGVYQTSKFKEEEGIWITMSDGSKWKLCRTSSKRSQEGLRRARKPHLALIQRNDRLNREIPDDIQDEINIKWAIYGIVMDWDGVTGPDGETLEFTSDNVETILRDLPDLNIDVVVAAGNAAAFQDELDEEAAGNLKKSSPSN